MIEFTNRITITIPVFERFDFFENALNCNIIIVDNNSENKKFSEHIQLLNISYVSYKKNDFNVGMVDNWNKCFEYCNTEWITILHDDDILYPNFVEYFLEVQKKKTDAVCICSNWESGNLPDLNKLNNNKRENLKIRTFSTFEFHYTSLSPFPGIAINLAKINLQFDIQFHPSADYDMWVRISKVGKIYKFQAIQAFYRLSEIQTSVDVYKDIIRQTYLYKKDILKYNSFIQRIFSLATTYNIARVYSKRYQTKIDWTSIIYKEDKLIMSLFKYDVFLYVIYLLKYIIYKLPIYFKYKK
jgi:hypothetical protein